MVDKSCYSVVRSPPSLLSLMINHMSSLDACVATSEAEYSVVAVIVDVSSKLNVDVRCECRELAECTEKTKGKVVMHKTDQTLASMGRNRCDFTDHFEHFFRSIFHNIDTWSCCTNQQQWHQQTPERATSGPVMMKCISCLWSADSDSEVC
jgi:hypothetical protein